MAHPGVGGWASGWWGFHVVQWQKLNPNDPASHYRLNPSIKDANSRIIDTVGMVDATSDAGHNVPSRLPLDLIITTQYVDDDALLFVYGDQKFGSNDQEHHCKFGGYEDGNRKGDCGFTC